MYIQCGEREVCMYNIYGTNQYSSIFRTKCFSRPSGRIHGIYFQKKVIFQKARHYSSLIYITFYVTIVAFPTSRISQ